MVNARCTTRLAGKQGSGAGGTLVYAAPKRQKLALALVVALVLAMQPNVATADPGGGGKGGPIKPASETYDPGTYSTSTSTSGSAFACDNESRNPHHSTHQSGRVNAEGYTSCTAAVQTYLYAELYKEFAWLWWTKLSSNSAVGYGTVSVFVNAPCQGNLNYRIKTWHTTQYSFQGTVTTANVKYVQCQ